MHVLFNKTSDFEVEFSLDSEFSYTFRLITITELERTKHCRINFRNDIPTKTNS